MPLSSMGDDDRVLKNGCRSKGTTPPNGVCIAPSSLSLLEAPLLRRSAPFLGEQRCEHTAIRYTRGP
ncbi:hypothetical protein MRX96_045962 [Rhipicephalus microplus]